MNTLGAKTAYVGGTEIKQVRLGNKLVLAPNGDSLWYKSNELPSLDLRFAQNKSLVDATTGAQLVTFTRASSGTFVGSDGLIRTAVTNLLLRSEEFNDASWTAVGGSVSTNSTTSPFGAATADLFTENATTAQHDVRVTSPTLDDTVTYTTSVYAKSNGRNLNIIFPVTAAGHGAVFDLTNGTVTVVGSVSAVIQSVGGGWYRCSVTGAKSGSGTVNLRFLTHNGTTNNYTGDGTSGIYIWGAQLEQSSTVGEYIPTTSTINSAPRFDHNPTTGESLGLLVEEQRTNSIRNNTMVGAVAGTPGTLPTNWSGSAATDLTREVVGTGTENGVAYIDLKYTGTVSASRTQFVFFEPSNQIAASNGQSWAGSAWVKIVAGSLANITSVAIQTDTRDASLVYVSTPFVVAFTPTSAFTRYSGAGAATGATINWIQPFVRFITASSGTIDITLRIGLPQLEQGAFATSVIPTTTATVTRSADVASISGSNFSGWFNQTEGSLCARFLLSQISNTPLLADVNDSSTANRFALAMSTGRNGQLFVNTASTSQGTTTTTNAANIGALASLAFAYKADDCNVVLNGGSVATDTSVSLPVVNNLFIGFRTSNQYLNSSISRLTYWPTRLPNSTLQAVTQ
jgi:hypothetical protein